MLPTELMSLHDIPKRKEKRTIALCVQKQSGYVRCGWRHANAHAATTAAAPSTSTPPSHLRLLLSADDATAAILLNSLLRRLFLVSASSTAAGSTAADNSCRRRGRCSGCGNVRVGSIGDGELGFLYEKRLQLRKLCRRLAERRKRTMSIARVSSNTTSASSASASTYGTADTTAAAIDICGDGGEHVSELLRWRRLLQQQQRIHNENATQPPVTRRHQLNRQRTQHSTPPTCPIHASRASAGGAVAAATATAVPATPMMRQRTLNQHLNALLKPFKNKQIAELLQAVKSRVDPPPKCNTLAANNNNNNSIINSSPSYLQCILIKCTSPLDEEQHVTTCQLFFWSDLRDASELRRLPICPSARDYVYTCCNPLHWYRIIHPIDTESAPPPYQRSKMLRLRDTDSEGNTQNIERSSGGNSSSHHNNHNNSNSNNHSQSISSIFKQAESQLYVPSLESFTTDGKDRSACSKVWCQIAYWELSQRVGELFQAKKPAVNIYAEGPADGSGESMCLRELGGKRPPTDAVQNTRLKVGLGVTLSMESGGDVWIYNRSNVPIFVDSPTLAESLDRVCKVMPGYCLKAFDTHRAQWLASKQSQHNQQLGPIDRFSMKISFAKGWGNTYKRQDVMGCPCWLEVHFTHLR